MASNTEISEIIGKELKCYICKSGPKARKNLQGYRFPSMHQICRICRESKTEDVKKCSCGKAISDEYCKMTEAILKSKSIRFMCENQERGCQEILDEESMICHEPDCILRLVKCPKISCKFKGSFHKLLEHMEEIICYHDEYSRKVDKKWIQKFTLKYFTSVNPMRHNFDGRVFFSIAKVIGNTFFWWVQVIGSQVEAKNYYYTLEFHGIDPEVRTVHTGQVFPIDETSDSITTGYNCLTINIKAMRTQFIDQDEQVSYSVSIQNMKEEAKDDNVESGISDDE